MLREHAQRFQEERGSSFQRSWAQALADHPELQESDPANPAGAEAVATSPAHSSELAELLRAIQNQPALDQAVRD